MISEFEKARQKYKPANIKYLLVAEAPPLKESKRFFYFENVNKGDSLFVELMRVLFLGYDFNIKTIRSQKKSLLNRFKENGFYLIDASNQPIRDTRKSAKIKQLRNSLPLLKKNIKKLVNEDTKVILISATVYEVCCNSLHKAGFSVINDRSIDFPGSGNQEKFREKFGTLMKKHGWNVQV